MAAVYWLITVAGSYPAGSARRDKEGTRMDKEEIAREVVALRKGLGMSQTDLANAMTARGVPWHQTTVSRIEGDRRDVTLIEGRLLNDIIGLPLTGTDYDDSDFTPTSRYRAVCRELEQLRSAIRALA